MIPARHFRTITAVLLGALLLASPQAAAEGVRQGLAICLQTILPALFPFLVLCSWLTANLANRGFALALGTSWLGGYAVCAQNLAALQARHALTPQQVQLLLIAGCCSSPGFVIGCVGGQLLGSVPLGVLLYGLQLAVNLLCAALLSLCKPPDLPPVPQTKTAAPSAGGFAAALSRGVDSCLTVCGCVIFFRIVYCTLAPVLPSELRPLASALLEISAGCTDFAAQGGTVALYGCCCSLGVLGLSVFVQMRAFLGAGVPWRRFLLSRVMHTGLLLFAVRLLSPLLPGTVAAYSSLAPRVIPMNRLQPDTALLSFCFFCAVLYKIREKFYNRKQHKG